MLVQNPATFEAATKIDIHMGTILGHTWYGKGLKKLKSKVKNPYYISYCRDDVVGGDIGPVPIELGKATKKYWTCRGAHF